MPKYFFDTEFSERPCTIDLISIGIVSEDGRELYCVSSEFNEAECNEWVRENVIPLLPPEQERMTRKDIANAILDFIGDDTPEFWGYYCVTPETKVLTSNLDWVDIGDIDINSKLIGFDEHTKKGKGRSSQWRQWREATVTSKNILLKPCYKLVFDDGTTVTCSDDHLWLTYSGKACKWSYTKNLVCRSPTFSSNVVKPVDVWNFDESREAGYLSAAFDGEGSLDQMRLKAEKGACKLRLSFAQKDNSMLFEVKRFLHKLNFSYTEYTCKNNVVRLTIGNRADVLRFLGSIRPVRLLPKFQPDNIGAMFSRTVKLVEKIDVGIKPVVALGTSTGTYIAEGLASHNCDYDWVVFCWLFGSMIDLPNGWPMYCRDLKQLMDTNPFIRIHLENKNEHDALADARWCKKVYEIFNLMK